MGLRNLLRRAKREEQRHGVQVEPRASDLPQVHQLNMSQETLDLLVQGRNSLLQRRQELVQQLQQVEAAIQKQEGGITVMQGLLAGQKPAGGAPEGP